MMISEVAEVKTHSQEINHDTTRVIEDFPISKAIRQGDVYVKRVEEINRSEYKIATLDMQIAKGNTKGSRHILVGNPSLKVWQKTTPAPLEGPGFESSEPIHLTHPEHPNFILPAGKYVSFYQQDFAREEIAAVRD